MPKRRRLPLSGKAKQFTEVILAGGSKKAAVNEIGGPETTAFGFRSYQTTADKMLTNPDVANAILRKLRSYQATWRDLEEAMRGVLARHMSGLEADGTPIEGLDPLEREQLSQRAALGVLAALSKHSPETFASRAAGEDEARLSLPEMARLIVGEPSRPALPPPSVAPGPPDEETH